MLSGTCVSSSVSRATDASIRQPPWAPWPSKASRSSAYKFRLSLALKKILHCHTFKPDTGTQEGVDRALLSASDMPTELGLSRVVCRLEGGVGVLTLNRPERSNAMDEGVWTQIPQASSLLEQFLTCSPVITLHLWSALCRGSSGWRRTELEWCALHAAQRAQHSCRPPRVTPWLCATRLRIAMLRPPAAGGALRCRAQLLRRHRPGGSLRRAAAAGRGRVRGAGALPAAALHPGAAGAGAPPSCRSPVQNALT